MAQLKKHYLLPLGNRSDVLFTIVSEGNDPRDGSVWLEREEVLPGASDDAAAVSDERRREGTTNSRWHLSCSQTKPFMVHIQSGRQAQPWTNFS